MIGAKIGQTLINVFRFLAVLSGIGTTPLYAEPMYNGFTFGTWGAVTPSSSVFTISNQTYLGSGPAAQSVFSFGVPVAGFGQGAITLTGDPSFSGVTPGTQFDLGTLTFFNSSLVSGAASTVRLSIDVNADGVDLVLPMTITITNTPNTSDPVASADFLTITSDSTSEIAGSSVSVSAFEGDAVSVQLIGEIIGDPVIDLAGLSITPDQEANGFLGTPSDPVPGTFEASMPVSEPGTLMILGGAVLFLLSVARRSTPAQFRPRR